ncbi:ABC transporter ATP-binding protein [Couchioplanes azureus]|uniref:ABC transporter ATP-binding protein n=1 Tax=Couchioplanes caeruleus TaxID=56438 RepID=UPI0016715853|nr:ABC transporter ATP-binding protein [Couchioplanes caeruleus]GGQ83517.1 ABC transporter ATP-binding protein [Couchioplanes caeruleus subsp. azureus]
MADEAAIEARDLRYSVDNRVILDDLQLAVPRGRSVAITGPSGSGKTTLLMCIAGIIEVDAGTIRINGSELTTMKPRARAAVRLRDIGIVYQFGELLPELTLLENIALPVLLAGGRRREAYDRARALLADLGLEALTEAATATLSGGERQRVAVARALVSQPAVVLADEPTGSLDQAGADAVSDLLFDLPKKYGCALVVVTHNSEVAARADHIVALRSASGSLAVAP